MTHYWNNLFDAERLLELLRNPLIALYDMAEARDSTSAESMRGAYPDYEQRRYYVYSNGACYGYVTDETIEHLLSQGVIVRDAVSINNPYNTRLSLNDSNYEEKA